MSQSFDVFLSHNSSDKPAVIELAEALKARKLQPWLDFWELPPGQPWQEVLEQTLKTIPAAAVLVGQDGLGPWESVEMRALLAQCVERKLPVIPVLLPGAMGQPELPLFLRSFTWVDLRKGLSTEGLDRLVWGITGSKVDPEANTQVQPASPVSDASSQSRKIPRRNPLFTGRDELLAELRKRLTEEPAPIRVQALTGLGGVGKTQLAFQYAHQYEAQYDVVLWVRAEEPTTLASDFAGLAQALDLPARNIVDQQVVGNMVRRWLQQNSNWLLIFDNAADTKGVEPYLVPEMRGHVLITSRNPAWGSLASKLEVAEFTPEEAAQFLLDHTRRPDEEAAAKVAEELGHLPLALEQPRAYLEVNDRSLASYLDLLRSHRRDLLAQGSTDQTTVATTWEISFQQVEQTSPAAAALLRLCAFLGPEDIPCTVLAKGGEVLPQELPDVLANPLRLDEVVGILRRYSLVDFDGEGLSLHRLVQAAIRDRLTSEQRRTWTETAVSLIQAIFPFDHFDVKTWDESVRLLPHVWATTERAIALGVARATAARLLDLAGQSLGVRADYVGAKEAFEKALAVQESVYQEDHLDTAQTLNDLGWLYDVQGDFEKALPYFERALAIREAQLDERHPDLAQSLHNLGGLLQDQGDYEGARLYYDRALAIQEDVLGENHPRTATSFSKLGELLQAQGDYEGARSYYDRALAIQEDVLGENHPNTAKSLNNLGILAFDRGQYSEARSFLERALKAQEATLGESDPNIVKILINLGTALARTFHLIDAKRHLKRAQVLCKTHHGHQVAMMREVQGQLSRISHGSGKKRAKHKKPRKKGK